MKLSQGYPADSDPHGLRVLLLTADGLRHRYAAATLASRTTLVGVVVEAKRPISVSLVGGPDDEAVVQQHFAERTRVERRMFGTVSPVQGVEVLEIASGTINSPSVFRWILDCKPDLVVLYGTGLIKPPLLEAFDGRLVNVHLGLSPYYRGAGTNFWPLVNGKPECVGATIHLAVSDVDAGPVLAQLRPDPAVPDRSHEFGTKTIIAAFEMLPWVLADYVRGRVVPTPQDLSCGRVFKEKDFNADAVRVMWRNFDAGMMEHYVSNLDQRCRNCPIIQPGSSL